jgi:hypothetical protein
VAKLKHPVLNSQHLASSFISNAMSYCYYIKFLGKNRVPKLRFFGFDNELIIPKVVNVYSYIKKSEKQHVRTNSFNLSAIEKFLKL